MKDRSSESISWTISSSKKSVGLSPDNIPMGLSPKNLRYHSVCGISLLLLAAIVFFYSNPHIRTPYDYTFRIAKALLAGHTGLSEKPPQWLNEFVPHNGQWYSVFPLGSVLCAMPMALLESHGFLRGYQSAWISAFLAGGIVAFAYLLSLRYDLREIQRIALVNFIPFGSWYWANVAFEGSWHHALGFAVFAQLGALCCILCLPKYFWAGVFFAIAFGNRTEIILLAPLFYFLIYRKVAAGRDRRLALKPFVLFSICPFLLGIATLYYNFVRFDSILDFGYARIPGVLDEPWYRDGIFALSAIPRNFNAMFVQGWRSLESFPFYVPNGFGGSIFISTPALLMLLAYRAKDYLVWLGAWLAILVLTFVLWCHGNPGGWQVSYRYGLILLPWIFVILLETAPRAETLVSRSLGVLSCVLIFVSVLINAWSTYLFLWTQYMRP